MTEEHEYDLPEGWRHGRIGGVVLKAKQRDPRKAPEAMFQYVDVSGVSNESFRITEATPLKGKDAPSRARKEILEDDVLFATVRPTLKRVALVPKELHGQIASTGYSVLRSDKSKVEPRYLYAHLLTDGFIARMGSLERGAGYPAVRESDVLGSPLPLPPLPEQQRIAQVLSTVQEAIAQQERLIRTTTELKQALMQKLFTEGLRGEALKETEIGRVPESWEVVELGDVFKFTSGKPKPKDTTLTRSGERPIPVYGGNGIMGYTAELLLDHTTLILGRVGEYCGCAHLTEPKAWITDNALYVKEDKLKPNYEYLREHLDHLNLNQYSNKMGQPLITQGIIGKVKFGLPTRKEQDEIATALKAVQNRIHVAELKRNALQDLFRTLLHELMTGKVRVREHQFT